MTTASNKGMKLTRPVETGASQLIPGVLQTKARSAGQPLRPFGLIHWSQMAR